MATSIKREGVQDVVLHDVLGQGGMAVVYRGTQSTPAGTRTVAIKRIADRGSREATARLVEEGRLVFRLNHANICQVLDLAVTDEGTFLIMEYVDGTDLRHLIAHAADVAAPLDTAFAVYAARETARALDYAHRRTDDHGRALLLVHGDVTPQNILVSREGEVKLSDFGIARSLGNHAPGNDLSLAGTPYFIAPEVLEAGVDHRADVYALGVTLYLALGGMPFESGIDLRDLDRRYPALGDELIRAIERATAPIGERYTTSGELESALAAYLARRFPHFTPSMLGQAVRRMAPPTSSPKPIGSRSLRTLSSLTARDIAITIVDRLPSKRTPSAPDGIVELRPRTLPAAARRGPSRAFLAVCCALLVASIAVVGVTRHTRARALVAERTVALAPPPPVHAPPAVTPPVPHPSAAVTPSPRPAATRPQAGFLSVSARPWGVLYVDGRKMASHTPVYRMPIAAGAHGVQVRSPDGARRSPSKQVVIEPRQAQVVGFEW